jgi:ABC-type uncharacterized transport system permease subunit
MTIILISCIAISLYLITAGLLAHRIFRLHLSTEAIKVQVVSIAGFALLAHALVLMQNIITNEGLNLGFYHSLSLMSWVVALLVIIATMVKPLENLSLVFLPLTALALLLEQLFPSLNLLTEPSSIGLELHILLSVTAYGVLTIAALQSIILAIQERQLRNKQPNRVMGILPPLQTMEILLIQLIAIGFFLLSLSLATGMMFVHDIFAQHISHKTVLSILAWCVFAGLLWGRWAKGWRGKHLIRWTLSGFSLLVLAYFGTKIVYEFILKRGIT